MKKLASHVSLPIMTKAEERANTITHGIGLVLSVIGCLLLILATMAREDLNLIVGGSIFGGTLVFMYTTSTLYHSTTTLSRKRLFRIFDHIAIYLLIAGTYTPFALLYFDGGWTWTLLGVEWGLALSGAVFKLFFTGRYRFLSLSVYLGMGWLIVFAAEPFLAAAPPGCIAWIVAGGLCYTGGVLFYAWQNLPYHHAIWHLFVLGGSVCHYLALTLYL